MSRAPRSRGSERWRRCIGRAATAALALFAGGLAVAGCSDRTAIPPVAPEVMALTPLASVPGTPRPTVRAAAPAPTAAAVATRVVAPDEPLLLPEGFAVSLYASDVGPIGMLAVAPTGEVFASLPEERAIAVMRDTDHDLVADEVLTYAREGPLNEPFGLAFFGSWLYVANTDGVIRYPYLPGDVAPWQPNEWLVPLAGGGDRPERGLAFGPDGRMYVSVGASCNQCVEADIRRASVLRFDPDGLDPAVFAIGLHNAQALAFDPTNGQLWAGEESRGGDDPPPDELNWLVAGNAYGWPYCFSQRVPEPKLGNDPRLCEHTRGPSLELAAGSVPTGMVFYDAAQFPSPYRGDLFMALHGDRKARGGAGLRVVRVPFSSGGPEGYVEDFVSGWVRPDGAAWGQPVSVAVATDGSLLVGDDYAGRVYRVFYAGPPSPDGS